MTIREKFLMEYMYNRMCRMEREIQLFKNNMRFHNMDENDHLEAIILTSRVDMFNELWKDISKILLGSWK